MALAKAYRQAAADLHDINERAAAYAAKQAGKLIADLTKDRRTIIQKLVQKGLDNGWSDAELADRMKNHLGLHDRYSQAVENYRQGLLSKGVGRGDANRMAREYAGRLRDQRALTVARTEVAKALNTAQREVWADKQENGDLSRWAVRIFKTHKDERTCPICKPLNGRRAAIRGGHFEVKGLVFDGPPLHPNCRCHEELVDEGIVKAQDYPDLWCPIEKTRHVRTPEGARRYNLPIGAPITPGAAVAAHALHDLAVKPKKKLVDLKPGEDIKNDLTGYDIAPEARALLADVFGADGHQKFGSRHFSLAVSEWDAGNYDQRMGLGYNAESDYIQISGHVLDENDNEIGEWTRTIYPNQKRVYHAYLKLQRNAQGTGFARDWLQYLEGKYRENGIEVLDVEPGLDRGGYAWAALGFQWNWQQHKNPYGTVPSALRNWALQWEEGNDLHMRALAMQARIYAELLDDGRPDNDPTPQEIARLGWEEGKTNWPGKDILSGTSWEGRKNLADVQKDFPPESLDDLYDMTVEWADDFPESTVAIQKDKVRTPSGEKKYGQPIGTVIVPDLLPERPRLLRPGFHTITDDDRDWLKGRYKKTLPPGWKDVIVTDDRDHGGLIAIGVDSKGRHQYVYSPDHTEGQAAEKFIRIDALSRQLPELDKRLEADAESDPVAGALVLMRKLGMRIGDEKSDTKATVKAHGATNLRVGHVTVKARSVAFDFVGKKGVHIKISTSDPLVRRVVVAHMQGKNPDDQLFGVSPGRVARYLKGVVGPKFKPHDLRTTFATGLARVIVTQTPHPEGKNRAFAFRRARMEVGRKVARALGNSPSEALDSYINPVVFAEWEAWTRE